MTGQGLRRPVLLLHGWTMRGAVFDDLATRLGPGVTAPDLPGHGRARDIPPSVEAAVDMLEAEVARCGSPPIVVGWSLGAAVAWRWLERGGAGAAGLVTVDMSPKPVNDSEWRLGLLGLTPARLASSTHEIRTDWPSAAEKIATTMFAERAGAPTLSREGALTQILSNDPCKMAEFWTDLMAMDLREAIGRVRLPWRVAFGTRSRLYPAATADWLASASGLAIKVPFASSGHSPHLEEPEAFAQMLKDFATELSD